MSGRYKAPALELGLNIMEWLARAETPLSLDRIAEHLDARGGDVFRVVQVLKARGYICETDPGPGIELTNKPLSLVDKPRDVNIEAVAAPLMADFNARVQMGCHLSTRVDDSVLVIASLDPPDSVALTYKAGSRFPIPMSNDGLAIYSFLDAAAQQRIKGSFGTRISWTQWDEFDSSARRVRQAGRVIARNRHLPIATDVSFPIFLDSQPVASMTMVWIKRSDGPELDLATNVLAATIEGIAARL